MSAYKPLQFENRRKNAKDAITPEEQDAIDAAIAAGNVTRVPAGVSGMPQEYRWCEKMNGLRNVDFDGARDKFIGRNTSNAAKASITTRSRQKEQKIAACLDLHNAGQSLAEIAAAMNMHKRTVARYLKTKGVVTRSQEAFAAVIVEAKRLKAEGHSNAEIARRVGRDRKTVAGYFKPPAARTGAV